MSSLTLSAAWHDLERHATKIQKTHMSEIILGDAMRMGNCMLALDGLRLNYAFNRVTAETISLLVRLAEQQNLSAWRERMLGGDKINTSENRAVLHTALRQQDAAPVMLDGHNVTDDVMAARRQMADFVTRVRGGEWRGVTGKPIRHVVNIGIGGSDLGLRLAVGALAPQSEQSDALQVHFVANADAYELVSLFPKIPAEETLFVVVSKTFTTQETLLNARTARQWLVDALGEAAVAQHFVAVSTNHTEVAKFGIDAANIFPMWDWVGGRFSVWSAVGLSVALALGMENFNAMLAGAAAMDTHFRTAPLAENLPVMLGLLGIWNRNFLGTTAQAILPYSERLRDLPRFLQQLEMESNGKSVTRDDAFVDYGTAPVIFGDCGTVGQHSFLQCLHQGHDIIPVDFIGVVQDDWARPAHHNVLLTNMVAQAGALAFGQPHNPVRNEVYVGNRPSTMIMLDALTPYHFGMLLALYEHKVFVQGIIWNINSFDQAGVELGKKLARQLEAGGVSATPTAQFMAAAFVRLSQR